ncbi:hypothetical protein C2H96_19505 [Bacillus subtilis]|nr:hypothetical protein C2H96_19505 [Bacillus subtilis]UQZ69531.1 hypothetical protein C2I05_02775 [Bacillus subtilis]
MYEFDQKQYLKAIYYYRQAEKQLIHVLDEIERVGFYFKLTKAHYGMKKSVCLYITFKHRCGKFSICFVISGDCIYF